MVDLKKAKELMLKEHLIERGVLDKRVIAAFREVPREEFVPTRLYDLAYEDMPLGIGSGQIPAVGGIPHGAVTISQPYTVAFMTQLLNPKPNDAILEVGTGSGYQAAILSRLVKQVYTIERFVELGQKAEKVLRQLGYDNVEVTIGDGSLGLPSIALMKGGFDGIIVTAAAPRVPNSLIEQLKIGGRLVIPVGELTQEMLKITKTEKGLKRESHPGFRFVSLIGEHGFKE